MEIENLTVIKLSVAEMRTSLKSFQNDTLLEVVAQLYRNDDSENVNWRKAAELALICSAGEGSTEFNELFQKAGSCPWINTPKSLSEWIELAEDCPFLFFPMDTLESLFKDKVTKKKKRNLAVYIEGELADSDKILNNV